MGLTCSGNTACEEDYRNKFVRKKRPFSKVEDRLRTPQDNRRSDLFTESVKSKCGDDSTSFSGCRRDAVGGGAEARGEYLKGKRVSWVDARGNKARTYLQRGNTGESSEILERVYQP